MVDDYIALARRLLAGREPRTLEVKGAREAAVLVLLYHYAGQEHVLFTVRTTTLEHHKGQISFPGGGRHGADEDLATTALRETWEEVGIHPDDVELIGRLDESLTTSNYRVTPFVGVLHHAPYEFVPSPIEVAEVLEVPLRHLLDPANLTYEQRAREDGGVWLSPEYWHEGYRIWGATARMLQGFLDLLRDGDETGPPMDADERG
jgi:8-oxo-dGTP pyrophosphatase MutT (NUDIX family)